MKKCLLGLLCLFISIQLFGQTLESDRLALVAIYNATSTGINEMYGGPNFNDITGWNVPGALGDSPCGWTGVTCEGGRVTRLDLSMFQVHGPLAPEVGNLGELKYLNIEQGGAELSPMTGEIPPSLGNLQKLEYFEMRGNVFSGTNMQVIGSLTKLTHLAFDTPPSWTIPASFQNLVNLEYLYFGIRGGVEWPEMGSVGAIPPYFGNFTKLETLSMSWAGLTGVIPSSLGNLVNLEVLDLSQNQLTGTIPASFNNLTKLTKLDLSNNNLTGPIPDILGIPVAASVDVSNNLFGLAGTVENRTVLDKYAPQGLISLIVTPGFPNFSVIKADGVQAYHATNAYKYFRDEVEVSSNQQYGDYWATEEGSYRIEVRNSLLPDLVLSTNTKFVKPPLPVTLISFDGKFENNQTKLTWKTTFETNNKGFEIERSADARSFEKIGFVDGNGDSKEVNTYHFTDLNPLTNSYYRLKQLDHDGKFEYSKVIVVKSRNANVCVYPNPAQEYLTIGDAQTISILDQMGRVVMKRQVAEKQRIGISKLTTGVYTVMLDGKGIKFFVIR